MDLGYTSEQVSENGILNYVIRNSVMNYKTDVSVSVSGFKETEVSFIFILRNLSRNSKL